jgi:hypothetical protein
MCEKADEWTQDGKPEPEEATATRIRRGAKRDQSQRAVEPEEPQVELEGEC